MTDYRVHPRLLPHRASTLFEKYATAVYVDGDRSVHDLAVEASCATRGCVFAATGPPRVNREELETLRNEIVAIAQECGYPAMFPSATQRAAFDAQATRVYLARAKLFPAEAAIGSIWAHHALVVLPDVTLWRWPPASSARLPLKDRFVPGRIDRHAYARLWWRATLMLTRAQDPGRMIDVLENVPEAEVDQVFTRHGAFGGSPETVRAILEVWRERTQRAPIADNMVARRPLLRAWLMALLRRGAFIAYDLLEPATLSAAFETVLDEVIDQLVPAGDRAVSRNRFDDAEVTAPVGTQVAEGAATADRTHETLIAAAFARALPNDEPVVISVSDRLAIQGARDNGAVIVELVDPRGRLPEPAEPNGTTRLLEMGFAKEPLGFARRIELSGDETHKIVGAVLARALSEAFSVPPSAGLRID